MAETVDLKKQLKAYYTASTKEPDIIDVPEFLFLCIDGQGNPASDPAYTEAVSALYSVAYTLKFAIKKQLGIDYGVMALEGLWWMADGSIVSDLNKDFWSWTMMILQPEWVTQERVDATLTELRRKKPLPRLEDVRLERYHEGLAVQLLHVGAYTEEHENIMRMHAYAIERGYVLTGKHHEIYLSDPRRTPAERLKTILRQPIAKPD